MTTGCCAAAAANEVSVRRAATDDAAGHADGAAAAANEVSVRRFNCGHWQRLAGGSRRRRERSEREADLGLKPVA